jgi:hypothetical protein
MQNLTETLHRELIPGFSKPVMNVKTLSVAAAEDEHTYIHSHVRLTEFRQ